MHAWERGATRVELLTRVGLCMTMFRNETAATQDQRGDPFSVADPQ